MQNKPHLTIGYLAPNVSEGNGLLLRQGILEQAAALGARLVTFAGGELHYPAPYFHQANQVYELADREQLDGLLIWTSSLATFIGQEAISKFCRNFSPLPVIGIGMPLSDVPSIILESYQGMRSVIEHLIQVHEKRRLVFIRGPARHYDAQERLRAYKDIVAEYGLENDPSLITPPCRWVEEDGGEAMQFLVEARRIQFDSVVSVNDQLARGAIAYLHKKGYRIPEDIALVGFDNNPTGRICTPPLTTVPNLMRERGRRAVEMLIKKISGEELPEIIVLSTNIKVRQSCGCQDPYIVQAGKPVLTAAARSSEIQMRSQILAKLNQTVLSKRKDSNWAEALLDSLQASLDTGTDQDFLNTLHDILRPFADTGLESREWQAALSELRQWIFQKYRGLPERIELGDRLLHQGRVLIDEITSRSKAHQEWMRNQRLNDLHRLRQTISANETLDDLLEALADEMKKMGINYGFLALYQDPSQPLGGAKLVLAFDKNGRLPAFEGRIFNPASRLTPPSFPDPSAMTNIMVHALYFGSEQLGFLVVVASVPEGSSHLVLREQVSSALKSVLLIEQNVQLYKQARTNQRLAEEANVLKSRFLSIVSHELLTPIVLLVGLSEMMLREGIGNRPELPAAYRQDLTRIHTGAQQLGSLVRDVLDLARSQLGQLTLVKKPIDVAEVLNPIELVCEQMATSKGLVWQIEIPENRPLIMGDVSRLQQVVLNLVSNAVKFTAQGSVKIKVEVEDEYLTIAVCDTGISVPADDIENIFDEFHQSERTVTRGYGGLGIGLAICRQLIEMHGGVIGVESSGEIDSGSKFYFSLPILASQAPASTVEKSRTVLILSETETQTAPIHQHLKSQGYEVSILAIDGSSNWLETLVGARFGALVLDFQETKSGWKVLDTIKRNPDTQDIPIIFYSLLQEQDSGAMLALDYVEKPVAAASLSKLLARYGITPESGDSGQSVLIVDDDEEICKLHTRLVLEHVPGCRVLAAHNGGEALTFMRANPPSLVLLDLMMPEVDGMAVLKAMQEEKNLRGIPVIVLTAQQLNVEDMERLNSRVSAVLAKGIYSTAETVSLIEAALERHLGLGTNNQRLVRKVMGYIHENFDRSIRRKDLAAYAGVSERHLNRCFNQDIGMTPLDYLNRYRIQQAKILLEKNHLNITEVLARVGFSDSSHFAHVFRREVGVSPSEYRRGKRRQDTSDPIEAEP